MSGPNFMDDPRMARVFGLAPRSPNAPASQSTAPKPMDIPAAESALHDRLRLGGKISPGAPKIGGEIETPDGTYGGEFSDDELAAYMAAAHDLANAKDRAAVEPLVRKLRDMSAAKPDATRQQ